MRALLRTTPLLFVAMTASSSASAVESSAARCVDAAERGQVERDDGHLLQSRATFAACGDESCPAVIRRECVHWLEEVDARIPTVVVSVNDDAHKDILDAEITIDGKPLEGANRGREARVDPGPHVVAAKRAGLSTSETVVVREREKGRLVALTLHGPSPSSTPTPTPSAPSTEGPARPVPLLTWILGGVAVAGGAGFAFFWSKGVDQVHDLRATCAPRCADARVDDASRNIDIAHVSLGIGVAAAVGAVAVYVLRPSKVSPSAGNVSGLAVRF